MATTIQELIQELHQARPGLVTKFGGTLREANRYRVSSTNQVVVQRDAATVAAELDMKTRAIQLVKDLGSSKTDAEIWAILQTLPSKQVNATAKQFILNGSTVEQKIARQAAWTEIQAVREEAVEHAANGGKAFSSPEFASATEEISTTSYQLWVDLHNGGQVISEEQLRAVWNLPA